MIFPHIPVLNVFIFSLIASAAAGLGAIPFVFVKKMPRKWLGISHALAAGLMLEPGFSLIYEGFTYNHWMVVGGFCIGFIFIITSQKLIRRYGRKVRFENLPRADASKVLVILSIMTLHSFGEGISVGVSFAGDVSFGLFMITAIALHNIPEGLAISLVMTPRGTSPFKAALWSIFSTLPQPLMAIPAFIFVKTFSRLLPMGLGFAGGALIWMVFAEILPDALEDTKPAAAASTITFAIIIMLVLQLVI